MSIVAIIPARYESSRFAGKPLALIAGVSMIERVITRTRAARCVTQTVVATDDSRIADAAVRAGARAVMTSDQARSGTDRIAEAAEQIGLDEADLVINVQGDQPLLDPRCLDDLTAPFAAEPDIDMATLAFRIVRPDEITNPKDVKVTFDRNGFALYFSRAQIPFARDGGMDHDTFKHLGVYAYSRRFLERFRALPEGTLERIEKLEQLRALEYGHRIRVVVTTFDSPEVDLPSDIPRIERLL